MDNRDKIKNLIINFSGKDNVIPIPVIYIKLLGDYHVAAFLSYSSSRPQYIILKVNVEQAVISLNSFSDSFL